MKKRVLMIAAIAAAVFTSNEVNAQDFKPAGGEKNIEVNFKPLGASPISINTLRFRYFTAADMAIRVGLSVTSSSDISKTLAAPGTPNEVELETTDASFGFAINPGVEMHFAGTDRLSPYWGAELQFATVSNTETENKLDAATADPKDTYEEETTDGSTTFGLNLLIGADWYFTKSMYMGTEVGFGFASTSEKDTETTNPGGKGNKTTVSPGGSQFNLGPNFNSSIRLGFLF